MMKSVYLAILCLALLIGGCPAGQPESANGSATPAGGASTGSLPKKPAAQPGGVLRLPLEIAIDDPAIQDLDLSDPRLWALARALELPLIRVAPSGELLPGWAERWESDTTGTIWTFELKNSLDSPDAAELEADADFASVFERKLVYRWQRELLGGSRSPLQAQIMDLVQGAKEFKEGRALEISGIEFSSPNLTFTLTRPNWTFPQWFSQPGLVMPREGAENFIGGGPFELASIEGSQIVLKPRDSLKGKPLLEELRFVCEPDRAEQLRMFRAGELDAANLPATVLMTIEDETDLVEAAIQHPTAEMLLCLFNYQRFPWDDGQFQSRVGLRQGMNWGLDRGLMAEMSGYQFEPWGHFLPDVWKDFIDPKRLSSPLYPNAQRIEEARAGLKAADHEQGIRLPQGMDLAYLPDENTGRMAKEILEYWREISVKMGPFGQPLPVLAQRIDARGHEVVLKRIRPAYPDVDALFYPQLFGSLSGLGGNWTGIEDRGIDQQIMTIQAASDAVSRKIALRKLSNELEDRALFVFIGYSTPTILLNPKLAGYELGPYDFDASLMAQDFTKLGWVENAGD